MSCGWSIAALRLLLAYFSATTASTQKHQTVARLPFSYLLCSPTIRIPFACQRAFSFRLPTTHLQRFTCV
ncbi:hypothetical protein CRE_15167 [Caenorhabditis remanei]|uniref:Secreted protein n=1 Tax=Caenorhabditis remanei TaxID=31234 RepID=E3NMV7_CAERE|nr:hypothetical protein CRE_15167 [Caenorhabditis remanei]